MTEGITGRFRHLATTHDVQRIVMRMRNAIIPVWSKLGYLVQQGDEVGRVAAPRRVYPRSGGHLDRAKVDPAPGEADVNALRRRLQRRFSRGWDTSDEKIAAAGRTDSTVNRNRGPMKFLRKPAILAVGAMASATVLAAADGGAASALPARAHIPTIGLVSKGGIPTCLTAQLAPGAATPRRIVSISVPADTCPPDN